MNPGKEGAVLCGSGFASDEVIERIADYVVSKPSWNQATLNMAGLCLLDSMACAIAALDDKECTRLLGPLFAGSGPAQGVPVPGTGHVLDPVKAAFDISTLIRWLDFSDTTFAGGHPSDNLGAILAAAVYSNLVRRHGGPSPADVGAGPGRMLMRDVFDAMIKAYEIQGILTVENRFDLPSIGLDHTVGAKIASTAVATYLLGGDRQVIARAVSNAWLDGQALNAYRHTPNAGTRKGWAAGDATSRGLWLAQLALHGEMGYPSPLTAPTWGFEAVYLEGKSVSLRQELGSMVMDNVIFKLYPCQRNATTAVECAIQLHDWLHGRVDAVTKITIKTQDEAIRRINKKGPLPNRAARDHSLQYVVAIGLLKGALDSDDYSDASASDPRIDWLRERMCVIEDQAYTRDHHDMSIRSCANSVQVELADGSRSPLVAVAYPIGDPSRRTEALPLLVEKFKRLTRGHWSSGHQRDLLARFLDQKELGSLDVGQFMALVA